MRLGDCRFAGRKENRIAEKRYTVDCRKFPSDSNCSLTISGREDELIRAATEHALSVHGHADSKDLRDQIRSMFVEEVEVSV